VLRRADVFVSHAGMNSTMEALYHAVPLVTVPQMPEQEANARRVEELGLGCRLDPHELTPERLRALVDEVAADEEIRANLAAMHTAIRKAGGSVAAADAIEARLTP
jgi:MGT family glycosyltransferase